MVPIWLAHGVPCGMKILHALPIHCRWIVHGDFNCDMVESTLDRSMSPCNCLMGFNEELVWVEIKKISIILRIIYVEMVVASSRGIIYMKMALEY